MVRAQNTCCTSASVISRPLFLHTAEGERESLGDGQHGYIGVFLPRIYEGSPFSGAQGIHELRSYV
jgi:hypothetical protein